MMFTKRELKSFLIDKGFLEAENQVKRYVAKPQEEEIIIPFGLPCAGYSSVELNSDYARKI